MPTAKVSAYALAIGALLGVSACSDSMSKETCLRSGSAAVCATVNGALRAEGLQPGSTVTVTTPETGSMEIMVGTDGHLVGSTGLIASTPDTGTLTVAIRATASDGSDLSGDLLLQR